MSVPHQARAVQSGPTRAGPTHLDHDRQRSLGAWYTPTELVEHIVELTLEPVLARLDGPHLTSVRIVDPACGTGQFLVAAHRRLMVHGLSDHQAQACLIGIDVDPEAIAIGRSALSRADLRVGDGTVDTTPVDVVMGNPPFLSPLRNRTRRVRSGVGSANEASVFLEVWIQHVRPGGRLGFVMPLSMLAARDAAPARRQALSRGRLVHLEAQPLGTFNAAVHTVVTVIEAGAPDPTGLIDRSTWSPLVADQFGMEDPGETDHLPTLGSIATATADFRDQYYGLVGSVADDGDGPPLIGSSLIGPGLSRWGTQPVRFAKHDYQAPRVDLNGLSPEMRRWAQRRLVPKVLVATQSKRLHAVADPTGAWLPSVPVITVLPHRGGELRRVEAALLDPRATTWARANFVGTALSPTAIKLSAAQVARIPLFD